MIRINYSPKLLIVCLILLVAGAVCHAQEPTATPATATSATATSATATSATTPPPAATESTATKSNKARIYFYRIKMYAGSALEPSVYCDDKELARMDNGRHFAVDLDPGEHTCRMGDKQTGFAVDLKAGEEYYAKITIDMGLLKGRGRLNLLQKEQGVFELKKTKPLGTDKVRDRSLVTVYEGSENKL
jgi:hypothetical protein